MKRYVVDLILSMKWNCELTIVMHCEARALVGVNQNGFKIRVLEKRVIGNSTAGVSC